MSVAHDENQSIDRQRVEQLAYSLWHQRGRPEGSPDEDWFRAERDLQDKSPPQLGPLCAFGIEQAGDERAEHR